ncbi:hypothetical protein [Chenggangzhangella methanolivorans]|uniref:Uncharacterized protein n=1 Tax=Chenggangzhangella methanolivorans TaxID=1437009 RepID=A0A9E6UPH3_9HYPH|nr:hypothetical protein [Chenggangzhangella methanolivorans]QZN99749.1 hypothetical protein K6K41_24295 [Chenggangzhangella methanolivorans]
MSAAAVMRYRVDPGDVPAEKAARRMGLTLADFETLLPKLLSRGFPPADPTTGNYDLEAIDAWRKRRNPHLFAIGLTAPASARDADDVVMARLEAARRG